MIMLSFGDCHQPKVIYLNGAREKVIHAAKYAFFILNTIFTSMFQLVLRKLLMNEKNWTFIFTFLFSFQGLTKNTSLGSVALESRRN